MASATFYTTAKRHNSTLVPSGGTTIDVILKDGSDMLTPTFKINYSGLPNWSMMQFQGRYYFITGYASLRQDLWEVSAAVDVLATYKGVITGSNQFVTYANVNNVEVVDNRLPVKTTATRVTKYVTLDPSLMTGQWMVAVTCAGNDGTATFLLTPAEVRALVNSTDLDAWFDQIWQSIIQEGNTVDTYVQNVLGDANSIANEASAASTDIMGLKAIGRGIAIAVTRMTLAVGAYVKGIVNTAAKFFRKLIATPSAMDCIKSAVFIPFEVRGDGASQNIFLGEFDTGVQAAPVINPIIHNQVEVEIPWQASDWRRNSPYHQLYLYLPFMGSVELSPSDLIGETKIKVYYSLNVVNGALNYRVASYDDDATLAVFACQCGVPYPIGASNITPAQVGTAIGGAAAAISGAGNLGVAAIAAASLNALRPSISCVGGGGGGAGSGLDLRIILHSVFHDTDTLPGNPSGIIGSPVMKAVSLAGHSGYVQTQQASVAGSMTDTEREQINSMLDGGIYIE